MEKPNPGSEEAIKSGWIFQRFLQQGRQWSVRYRQRVSKGFISMNSTQRKDAMNPRYSVIVVYSVKCWQFREDL